MRAACQRIGFAAVLLLPLVWPARAVPPQLVMRWDGRLLTLDAEGVPLSQVLRSLSAKTGIEIVWTGALNDPVSAHFSGMRLIPALGELLSELDYGIAGPPVTRVLIVAGARHSGKPARSGETARASGESKPEPAPPDADPKAGKMAAIEKASDGRDSAALSGLLQDADAAVQASAFQEMAAQDKEAAIKSLLAEIHDDAQPNRLQSLQMLVQSAGADQPAMDALKDALHDADPAFQAYAVKTLADSGDPAAIQTLSDAFHAANAAGKVQMIEQLAGSPGLPLLQEAASDSDATVSAAAKALLKGSPP